MSDQINFDAASAQMFNRRPGGSRHFAYEDSSGAVCLWCRSDLARGGVAISASAVEWLATMQGECFIRLTNPKGKLDMVLPVDQVPLGQVRDGHFDGYYIVNQRDLHGPDFGTVGENSPF